MMFSQFARIERAAGGVHATPRAFIRACHSKLASTGRSREQRAARHQWIREGLARKAAASRLYFSI